MITGLDASYCALINQSLNVLLTNCQHLLLAIGILNMLAFVCFGRRYNDICQLEVGVVSRKVTNHSFVTVLRFR